MADSVSQRIAEQYPFLAFLANDPEVGPLLRRAVDINQPFSPERFQAELMKTRWWRTQSDSQREWQVITNTRFGEAQQRRETYYKELMPVAQRLGIRLTADEVKYIAEVGLQRGWAADSTIMINELIEFARRSPFLKGTYRQTAGAINTLQDQIHKTFTSDWLMPVSPQFANRWASWIASGQKQMEDLNQWATWQALKRFPHMQPQLAQGMTVADIIEGQVATYAQELEVAPEEILGKVTKNSWEKQLLGIRDPKTNQMRLPTESEVIKMARQTSDYWKTQGGRQLDASMANSLLNTFGKRKTA